MDCSSQEEIFIDEWSLGVREKLNGKRYPLGGMLELTDRCNLRCLHCYINQPGECQAIRDQELSTVQIKKILNQFAEAGVLFLTLTGGEVLIRPDFLEIYQHAKKLGMVLTIFTNGTLLSPRIADELAEYRPRLIEITLYGATKETYEKVTGIPGSFERCMRGIDLILERGLPLSLKTIVLTENLHELPAMRAIAEDRGLSFRYDGLIWPRLDGNIKTYDYRLSPQQLVELDNEDSERMKEWKRIDAQYGGQAFRNKFVYTCGAGLYSFHVDSGGKISGCTMARQPNFDLTRIDFNIAWDEIGKIRTLIREKETICKTCTLGGLCNQCPGWSQLVHEDNEEPVDFLCQLAHLRAANIKNKGII